MSTPSTRSTSPVLVHHFQKGSSHLGFFKSCVPYTCNFDIFWNLGAKICVRRLNRLEDSCDFTRSWVNLCGCQHDRALQRRHVLCVLFGQPFVITTARKSYSSIITSGSASALRI